jgi:DNA-binding response OmpR family regulator
VQSNEDNKCLPLLHIDDSDNDRALVQQAIFLTGTHFTFFEAEDLESAMPYFQSDSGVKLHPRPALVLLDYDLGDHTGADFLYWLRLVKKASAIPVVMFSGSAGLHAFAECYSMGADHFISKPGDLARLKTIVRTLYRSIVSNRPGLICRLQEYHPDPRERGEALTK